MSMLPTKVLLATDGSEEAHLAARLACDMSKKFDAELHVVYVELLPAKYATVGAEVADSPQARERLEGEAKTKLDERLQEILLGAQLQEIREAGGEGAVAHARVGSPAAEIVRLAEELGVGLIVMGCRGLGGIRRALMGSVSDSVVRHAHCPVMVVRSQKDRASEHEAGLLT